MVQRDVTPVSSSVQYFVILLKKDCHKQQYVEVFISCKLRANLQKQQQKNRQKLVLQKLVLKKIQFPLGRCQGYFLNF